MIITKLYVSEKQKNKSCGFESTAKSELTFEESPVWIKDSEIMTISELKFDTSNEQDKKVLEYVNERGKTLMVITLKNGKTISNILVKNLAEIIPK